MGLGKEGEGVGRRRRGGEVGRPETPRDARLSRTGRQAPEVCREEGPAGGEQGCDVGVVGHVAPGPGGRGRPRRGRPESIVEPETRSPAPGREGRAMSGRPPTPGRRNKVGVTGSILDGPPGLRAPTLGGDGDCR